jgi:hypothetical protein
MDPVSLVIGHSFRKGNTYMYFRGRSTRIEYAVVYCTLRKVILHCFRVICYKCVVV